MGWYLPRYIATAILHAMDTPTTGAELLASWRERTGTTQAALADRLGVRQPTVAAWEGTRRPDLALALRLDAETGSAVPVESWGYGPELDDARAVLASREAVS